MTLHPKHCTSCGVNLDRVEPDAEIGPLSVSLYGECWWRGAQVDLTPGELTIVHTLASSPGARFRAEALQNLFGSEEVTSNCVQVLVCRVRKAFRAVDPAFDRIENNKGRNSLGYRWRTTTDDFPHRIRLETAPV